MIKKKPRTIITLERRREKIAKKWRKYQAERDRLFRALNDLEPPTPEELAIMNECDGEINAFYMSLHPRK